jgi:hypothetical protein
VSAFSPPYRVAEVYVRTPMTLAGTLGMSNTESQKGYPASVKETCTSCMALKM